MTNHIAIYFMSRTIISSILIKYMLTNEIDVVTVTILYIDILFVPNMV